MKHKILTGIAGLLLASSSSFAAWGVSIGVGGGGYYGPRERVFVGGGPAPVPVAPYCPPRSTYYAAPPAYLAPPPYGYVRRDPYYRGFSERERWHDRERARDIRHWDRRRY